MRSLSCIKILFRLRPITFRPPRLNLYFDIEAAPDKDLIYLHGVLVVNHTTQEETFHALVAETPEQEESGLV